MSIRSAGPARRLTVLAVPLCAAALLTAACGSDDDSTAKPAAAASPSASAAPATIVLTQGHITDGAGRTVYLWVADPAGTSTCSGACATAWPPVPAPAAPRAGSGLTASQLGAITRADGAQQLSYAGHALYYFTPDKAAGDAKGQGSNGFGAKWWLVSPSGEPITTPATTPAATSGGGSGGY